MTTSSSISRQLSSSVRSRKFIGSLLGWGVHGLCVGGLLGEGVPQGQAGAAELVIPALARTTGGCPPQGRGDGSGGLRPRDGPRRRGDARNVLLEDRALAGSVEMPRPRPQREGITVAGEHGVG